MINKTRDSDSAALRRSDARTWCWMRPPRIGLEPDGRLFALNSYENRVYQLGAGERALVLKFYRPRALERCADRRGARIHPRAGGRRAAGGRAAGHRRARRCCAIADFRFAAFPWMRGRAPELDAPEARQLLGRTLARMHQIGATRRLPAAPAHRRASASAGRRARRCSTASCCPSACTSAMRTVSGAAARSGSSEAFDGSAGAARDPPARGLPPRQPAVERAGPGVRRSRRLRDGPARPGPVDDARRAPPDEQQRQWARAPGGLRAVCGLRLRARCA